MEPLNSTIFNILRIPFSGTKTVAKYLLNTYTGYSFKFTNCIMIYGYVRVSTGKQTLENQKLTLTAFVKSKKRKEKIIRTEETESGTKSYKSRKLGNVITTAKKNDILIVSELSRLGRSLFEVMEILGTLMQQEVKVYSIKENFELSNNINSKVLAFAF